MKTSANYAEFTYRQHRLAIPLVLEHAQKMTGLTIAEIEDLVGRYVRGRNKGLLRGYLEFQECTHGGWVRMGPYDEDAGRACGFVARVGFIQDVAISKETGWCASARCPVVDRVWRRAA